MIEKVIDDLLQFSSVAHINDLLEEAADNIRTSFDLSEMMSHASSFHNMDWDDMETKTLPGEPQQTSAWYYMVDQDEAQEAIKSVIDVEEDQGIDDGDSAVDDWEKEEEGITDVDDRDDDPDSDEE